MSEGKNELSFRSESVSWNTRKRKADTPGRTSESEMSEWKSDHVARNEWARPEKWVSG